MAEPTSVSHKKPFFGFRREAPATPFTQADLTRELRAIVDNFAARETTRLVWLRTPAVELRDMLIAEVTRELSGRLRIERMRLSAVACKRAHIVAVQLDEAHVGAFAWGETSWIAQVTPARDGAPKEA